MNKGPRLNNISRNFTTRDSLGIEGVATSISAEICPIVNTVTPRPFYWAFITWCYYDFYNTCDVKDRSADNVYKYVKMQNYFLALASNITNSDGTNGFTGADTIRERIDLNQESFSYNEKYLKTILSNMGYYPAGLFTMGFIVDADPETFEKLKYPHLTKEGEKLAKAFEEVFSQTRYYKEYRKMEKSVPREVLIELSEFININLNNFDEVKRILIDHLFKKESQKKLIESHNYLKFIYKNYKPDNLNTSKCREIFYDYFSPYGENKYEYPDEFKEIVNSWEIVVGRQYFATGLEMIWKYMLENLNSPKLYKKWFNDCLSNSKITFQLNDKLGNLIPLCNYNYSDREKMIADAKSKSSNHQSNIENGIKLILSVYNRLNNRDDFSKDNKNYYNYGMDNNSISLNEFFKLVDEYKDKTIEEFVKHIMYFYLLNQHMNTAFEKMIQGRDGYYVEKIENEYVRKENFYFDFQGIRMVQLSMVMQDLNVLEVE